MRIGMGRWMFAAAVLSVGAAGAVQTSTELAREEFDTYVRRISGKTFPAAVEIGTLKTLGARVPAAAREALGRTEDIEDLEATANRVMVACGSSESENEIP